MSSHSLALDAALRVLRGASDPDAVLPALGDNDLAQVIALAPGAHPVVRAIAALRGGLPALLDAAIIASPALHDALARVIGTEIGRNVLMAWARVAPAGRGAAHADLLIAAEQKGTCRSDDAAALIGPCATSVGLLTEPALFASAIRRWGATDPAEPTAWASVLSKRQRTALLFSIRREPHFFAPCLPWLPPDMAHAADIPRRWRDTALNAFADASPTARTLHADLLRQFVADADPAHLTALTRLACATGEKEVWARVRTLIRESPGDAWRVAVAAPWNDLPDEVRGAILHGGAPSPMVAAVHAARGRRDAATTDITDETVAAFFAALDPAVWDALGRAAQQRWLQALTKRDAHLAVRSLGLRPEVLARAGLANDLVLAARRHAPDDDALRTMLIPVALHGVHPAEAHALIAALPPPRDSGAFFCIAGGRADPDLIAPARAALRTPDDLACAVALQRQKDIVVWTTSFGALLQHALRERTWDDLAPILALLTDDARADLMPDREEVGDLLAHPDHRERMRAVIDRLAALPPTVAIPTQVALHRWVTRRAPPSDAADVVAAALHAHGDILLAIADGLADNALRAALLPLPKRKKTATALRALVRDDPLTGRLLGDALRARNWRATIPLLLRLPDPHRTALTPAPAALAARLAAPERRADLHAALTPLTSLPPEVAVPALVALDAMPATNDAQRHEAADALAHALHRHGDIVLVLADALAHDSLRAALLPLPEDARQADALRALVRDDPVGGRALACALHDRVWRRALPLLLTAPPQHAAAIWQALAETDRRAITRRLPSGALPTDGTHGGRDPVAALALDALQSGDPDLQDASVTALAARPATLRAMWNNLPPETQRALGAHPAVAVVVADLGHPSPSPSMATSRTRRIHR